jgi:predicted glutamine amidotransferase
MCDILAISAGHYYTPREYLPIFAEKGKMNMNGWGVGFFRDDRAFVEKSAERVFDGEHVHDSFQRLARVIDSRIIVSHVSCSLSGGRHNAYNHPFALSFLDHTWLFVHVGVVQDIEQYQTITEPRLGLDIYPARVFEYLRDRFVSFLDRNPYLGLFATLRLSVQQLISHYPGKYVFFLANESVLFAFSNSRQLFLIKETETMGDILLITSVEEGLSFKEWVSISPKEQSGGVLFVVAGPDLLYVEDI